MSAGLCVESALSNVAALQQKLIDDLTPLPIELRRLTDAVGLVLAEEVRAGIANPRFAAAAVAGVALGAEAVGQTRTSATFSLLEDWPPSADSSGCLPSNSAVRVTLGGRIPVGAVAVVPEDGCGFDGSTGVQVLEPVTLGQYIRLQGEDIQPNQCLLEAGTRIEARHIMLLASQGLAEVRVRRPPVVAVISMGDEIRCAGQALASDSIYDSNRPYLLARLHQVGARVVDLGVVPDDAHKIREVLRVAAHEADLIVTSGSISPEASWLKDCFEELGELLHWRPKPKLGKPVAWGRIGRTPFLSVPGSPVAALVCTELFLTTALNQLSGSRQPLPRFVQFPIAHEYQHSSGRDAYLRAALVFDAGRTQVEVLTDQHNAALAGLARTEALLHLSAEVVAVPAGTWVEVLLL